MSGKRADFNNMPSGDTISWIVAIVCLIAFWPLGLFLLLKKISFSSKNKSRVYSQTGPGYHQKPQEYRQYSQTGQASSAYSARQPQADRHQTYQQQPPGQQQAKPVEQKTSDRTGTPYQPFQHGGASTIRQGAAPAGTRKQPYYHDEQSGAHSGTQWNVRSEKAVKRDKKHGPAKGLAVALTVLSVVLGLMGAIFLSSGLSNLALSGMAAGSLAAAIFGGFSLLGALMTTLMRGGVLRRIRRYTKYAAVICDRDIVSVVEIARAAGEPVKKTRKSLQTMLDSGYYGEHAYIDSGLDSFVISREAAVRAAGVEKAKTEAAEKENSPAAENQYVTIVNELHMLCSQTSDPAICGKIERIEALTVKIFKIVEENSEKAPQIRRFMNYYLPTTLKLLHSYQMLERQGIGGENINSAKQDIERILDTLAAGFEQQLDNLFKSDKLDISADIDVIENLMEQDGLTGDGGIMRTAGGQ